MQKLFQSFILPVLVFILLLTTADAQTGRRNQTKSAAPAAAKVEGVYAGILLLPGLNGMTLTTYTYYFRPDGTYATEFDKPDWKTRVDGNFTLKGRTITLSVLQGGQRDTMEIKDDGNIDDGSYTLYKLNFMNSVPAKRLENKSASSVGGMGTGLDYVGVFSNRVFYFDGKGGFRNDDESTTAVIGESIGGGTTGKRKGGGTYTIKDSVLTLEYPDGKTDTRSFFYAENPEPMALINGNFYYEYEDENKSETNTKQKEKPIETAADGLKILQAANLAQGGSKLDNLKTIRLRGTGLGFDVTILIDVIKQRIRNELSKDGKLVTVEQFDGNGGWQWLNKQKTPLTEQRIKEMKKTFNTGLLSLRSNLIKSASVQSAEVKKDNNLKTVIVEIAGEKYGMIFDAENRLVGEVSVENGEQKTTISKDFRNVDGVVFPFTSTETSKSQTIVVNFSAIEVNFVFAESSWAVPN
jgi:hypothetical protein